MLSNQLKKSTGVWITKYAAAAAAAALSLLLIFPAPVSAATISASLRPAFRADLTNTLKLQAGAGSPTFTRATTAYQTDFEGLMHQALSGEARFQGARRVQNLVAGSSENILNANWGRSGASDVTQDATGFYETTTNAGHDMRETNFFTPVANHTYVIRAEVKPRGTTQWGYLNFYTGGTSYYSYFNYSGAGAVGTNSGSSAQGIKLLSDGYYLATIKVTVAGVSGANVLIVASAGGDNVATFVGNASNGLSFRNVQLEDVTGQTNQNPSEYVSVGVLAAPYHGAGVDGVQYFNTLNGNTVASNVVTEATGAKITSAQSAAAGGVTAGVVDATGPLGYLAEGARTNIIHYSQGNDTTNWFVSPTSSLTANYASYDGLSFTRFVQGGSSDYVVPPRDAVPDAASAAMSVYYKQDGSASGTFNLVVWDNLQGSKLQIPITVAANGVITAGTAVVGTLLGVDALPNGVYRVRGLATQYNDTTDGMQPMVVSSPAIASVLFSAVQVEVGVNFASSYIPTTTGSATRNADVLTYQRAGNVNLTAGTASVEAAFIGSTRTATDQVIIGDTAAVGEAMLVHGVTPTLSLFDGTTYRDLGTISLLQTPQKFAISWGGSATNAAIQGVAGSTSPGSFDGNLSADATTYIGNNGASSNGQPIFATLRNLKVWPKVLTNTQLTNLTSTNSAVARAALTQGSTVKAPTATGLVGYWKFDEGTGTRANDSSGLGNFGTLVSSPTWTTGKLGKALSFNGSSSYVNTSNNIGITGASPFTMEAWINPSVDVPVTANNYMSFVKMGTASADHQAIGSILRVSGVNYLGYLGNSNDFYTNQVVPLNTWSHVVITYSGGTYASGLKLYLNGVVNTSLTAKAGVTSGTPNIGAAAVTIGERQDANSSYFNGKIDDVRIYNRALSATEVYNLYKSTAAVVNASTNTSGGSLTSGLVGLWSFDGKDMNWGTNQALDRSGQGNNGTLTNMSTSTSPTIGKIGQAMKFNGTSNQVNLARSPFDGGSSFTISSWIKMPALQQNKFISTMDVNLGVATYGIGFGVNNSSLNGFNANSLFLQTGRGAWAWSIWTSPTNSLTQTNQWVHAAVTVTNGNTATPAVTFYVNGTAQSATPWASGVGVITYGGSADASSRIGGSYPASDPPYETQYFNGSLDDVRIYNRALSATEVKALYNLGK